MCSFSIIKIKFVIILFTCWGLIELRRPPEIENIFLYYVSWSKVLFICINIHFPAKLFFEINTNKIKMIGRYLKISVQANNFLKYTNQKKKITIFYKKFICPYSIGN